MFVQEYRASKILYNFLVSNNLKGRFLLPANVCDIIPLTFHYASVDFDFIDIQNDNLCIDQLKVLNNVHDYQGLLFVRSYGIEDNFNSFFKNLKALNPDFIIIDDCCLCMPDLNAGVPEYADLKLYSLGYAKQVDMKVGAFGFLSSGFKYFDVQLDKFDPTHYDDYKIRLKNAVKRNEVVNADNIYFLENKKFNIEREQVLEKIELTRRHKERINLIYSNELSQSIQTDKKFQNWRFNILLENEQIKNQVLTSIFAGKLFASNHYFPVSTVWKAVSATNAQYVYERIINLFNDFYYSEQQAVETCRVINQFFKNK